MSPSTINTLLVGPYDVWDLGHDIRHLAGQPSYLSTVEVVQNLTGRHPSHARQKASRLALCYTSIPYEKCIRVRRRPYL